MLSIQLVQFILGIAILLVIHEFGHFLAARSMNVEVEEFGIGTHEPDDESMRR